MLALKVKYGEPLEQYYYAKLNLLNRCEISGRKAVDCILSGIEDRAIKLGAQAAEFRTPELVLKYLKTIKVGQIRDHIKIQNRSGNEAKIQKHEIEQRKASGSGYKRVIKCFNCGLEGHPSFKCPKPIEKCSNCYKIGHRTAACPLIAPTKAIEQSKVSGGHEKQILRLNVNKSRSDTTNNEVENGTSFETAKDKYIIPILVNDVPLNCYVDLGSECTIIRKSIALAIGLKLSIDSLPLMRGLGGNLVEPKAKTVAKIKVQDITETLEMFVVDDDVMRYPVLLGHSFTERPDILITKTPTRLIFEKITKISKLFLILQHDVNIDPNNVKSVPVICDNIYTGKVYVNGTVRGENGKEFYLLPGEYDICDSRGNLLIFNLSYRNLEFNKGELITRALPLKYAKNMYAFSMVMNDQSEGIVNCGDTMSSEQVTELKQLLGKFSDCFSKGLQDLGLTTMAEMKIHLKDCEPVVYRPYRLSHSERAQVREMVQEMLESNIIQESSSPYASPIVLVKKKTGEKRLCVDYRALNRKTIKDHYPTPLIEDQLSLLAGHTFFTSLDLASGYYQIPIAEESRSKTAFVTPDGQYEYTRMPFGLVNAPSMFQRTINKILADAKLKFAVIYMDDILIPAHNFEEGMSRLREVLQLLRIGGLALK